MLPVPQRRAVNFVHEAELHQVHRGLRGCTGAATLQPRVHGAMLKQGKWDIAKAAHSAALRAAGRIPAMVHAGHHHAPHAYSPRCRVCEAARDDWRHAVECPAPAWQVGDAWPAGARAPACLLEAAWLAAARHVEWRGQLAPAATDNDDYELQARERPGWPRPAWVQPVAELHEPADRPARVKMRWASKAQCQAALAAQSHKCVLAGEPGSEGDSPHVAWVHPTVQPGMPLPTADETGATLGRRAHGAAETWLAKLCGWLELAAVWVGGADSAGTHRVWPRGLQEARDSEAPWAAPHWSQVHAARHGQCAQRVAHVWWPASDSELQAQANQAAARWPGRRWAWLVPRRTRQVQSTAAEQASARTSPPHGWLVHRACPPGGWPLPWWPAERELLQCHVLDSPGSDSGQWECWWHPGTDSGALAQEQRKRAALAAQCHVGADTVASETDRAAQLTQLAALHPQWACVAVGRWPAGLHAALLEAGARVTQAAVTAWGVQVQQIAAGYWAARQRLLGAVSRERWGDAGWLPGASQLRDLAQRAQALWGAPATPLDAMAPPLHACVRQLAEHTVGSPFEPWPRAQAERWWRQLAALEDGSGGVRTRTAELAWLWLVPITMSTKAATYAGWGLTRELAAVTPGPPGGNLLAWLAQRKEDGSEMLPLQARAIRAAAKWRTRARIAPQQAWWGQLVIAWHRGTPAPALLAAPAATPATPATPAPTTTAAVGSTPTTATHISHTRVQQALAAADQLDSELSDTSEDTQPGRQGEQSAWALAFD